MRHRTSGGTGVILAVGLWAAAGCSTGPPVAELSGTVSVDGQPPARGAITFIPIDGKGQTAGCEIKDGKYAAKLGVGTFKVEIRVPKVVGRKKLYDTPDSPIQDLLEEVLPARYNSASELKIEVNAGKNEKDWDLKSK
jgi:hypothetical protein